MPSNNFGKLVQSCVLADGLHIFSVNMIHDACIVIPYIGHRDTKIAHYINPRSIWVKHFQHVKCKFCHT